MVNKNIEVGSITLGEHVDITDPSYEKDVWCRTTLPCVPGKYNCTYELSDEGEWGMRVKRSMIALDGFDPNAPNNQMRWKYVYQKIGVDSGTAGFFADKPDFEDQEWNELCDFMLKDMEKKAWIVNSELTPEKTWSGFWTNTGYGDGEYPVNVIFADDGTGRIIAAEVYFIW